MSHKAEKNKPVIVMTYSILNLKNSSLSFRQYIHSNHFDEEITLKHSIALLLTFLSLQLVRVYHVQVQTSASPL